MEDDKTIIHVGLPKTGTTFIQNRVLAESDEIFYIGRPYTQESLAFNMIQYCDSTIYKPEIVQSEIDKIKQRAEEKRIVISDEHFAGSPFRGFRNRSSVAERLSNYFPEAHIVLSIRNQVDLLISYFKQIAKWGDNESVLGSYQSILDERYVHGTGEGLSFDDWRVDAGWDRSRRYVSHHSCMSIEYFKYSKIYDLYERLFDSITVLLFEDFVSRNDAFFETWKSISKMEKKKIKKLSDEKVNKTKENVKYEIISNRIDFAFEGIDFRAKSKVKKIVKKIFYYLMDRNVANKKYVNKIVKNSGIPEDNKKLIDRGVENINKYDKRYLI